MTPEQWKRVNVLFHEALEQPADRRAVWLRQAAGEDAAVRREVEALLMSHERDPDFLEAPAPDIQQLERAAFSAPTVAATSLAGQRIGAYDVVRELGRGGMGVVYLGRDTRLHRDVAIKALPQELSADHAARDRLRREARAAAALTHPGIATIFALEESGDAIYVVSELVRGRTLREELAYGPLDPARALDTLLEITRAVGAAHAEGIVHRDLKPENVMRTLAGGIKILDFGLARAMPSFGADFAPTLTRTGAFLGTPAYMAPEQIKGESVDGRTDLFALGILAYELASGAHPFDEKAVGATLHHILVDPPRPFDTREQPALELLAEIVDRCLQKTPDQRYATAEALLSDLSYARGAATDAPPARRASSVAGGTTGRRDVSAGGVVGDVSGSSGDWRLPSQGPRSSGRLSAAREEFAVDTAKQADAASLWWWRFHQLAVALMQIIVIVPAWRVWQWLPAPWPPLLRMLTLLVIVVAVSIRLHLWWVSRFLPPGLPEQRLRARFWLRLTDWAFTLTMLLGGLAVFGVEATAGGAFVGIAACYAVVFLMVEPATALAAFGSVERSEFTGT